MSSAQQLVSPEGKPAAPAAPAQEWAKGLPDDARGFVELKGWSGPQDVIKSYRELESFHGVGPEKLLRLPDNPDEESMGAIFDKLGRPKAPENYDVPELTIEGGQPIIDEFRKAAHAAGLSQTQARNIAEWYNALLTQGREGSGEVRAQQNARDEASLRKEWGNDFSTNIQAATSARVRLGWDDATLDKLEQSMGLNWVMRTLYGLGKGMGEHIQPTGQPSGTFGMGALAAREQLALKYGPGSSGMQAIDNGDQLALAEFRRLNEIAAATEGIGGPPLHMRP